MGKSAAKKIVAPKKRTGEKRPAAKKSVSSRVAGAKEEKKGKGTPKTAAGRKKPKTAAKPSAKAEPKTKRSSTKITAGKDLPKTTKHSPPPAKKSSVAPTSERKPQKKASYSSAVSTGKKTSRPAAAPSAVGKAAGLAGKRALPASAAEKTSSRKATEAISPKTAKKTAAAAVSAVKKPAGKAVSVSTKKGLRRKAVLPSRIVAPQELPEEYGVNEVILMPVDPGVIFVDWEIGREALPAGNAPVTMRVVGVTTNHESGVSGRKVLELQLDNRSGSGFFDIGMPGREVAVEIGINLAGEFSLVIKSETVSMPLWTGPDECGLPETAAGSGGPVGY